jgi:hypothetical protein
LGLRLILLLLLGKLLVRLLRRRIYLRLCHVWHRWVKRRRGRSDLRRCLVRLLLLVVVRRRIGVWGISVRLGKRRGISLVVSVRGVGVRLLLGVIHALLILSLLLLLELPGRVGLLTIEDRAVQRHCFGELRLHLGQHLCGLSQPQLTWAR